MVWVSVVFGVLSALAWFGAAVIPPAVEGSYWNGPPDHITRRLKIGAALNTAGALFASISMAAQAYTTWVGGLAG